MIYDIGDTTMTKNDEAKMTNQIQRPLVKETNRGKIFFIVIILLYVNVFPSGASEKNSFCLEEFGLLTGYGKASIVGEDYKLLAFMPRWGFNIKGVAAKIGLKPPGRLEFLVEPLANVVIKPNTNTEVGCSFLLKYGIPLGHLLAFVEGGVGMLYMSQHTVEQGTQYNCLLQSGIGFQYFLNEKWALTSAYRFRHLSNAGISSRNHGINAHMALIGFSYFYK
jgi:lipid A 3-O-deacylase